MNECNESFLRRNGIVIEDVCQKVDCHVYSREEINPILAEYDFQTGDYRNNISIANIVGYDASFRDNKTNTNIFLSMDDFFNDKGSEYYSRSVGMLGYNKDDLLDHLKESFKHEPIGLIEAEQGKYTVFGNGLHRYTLLRILYLSELAQANGNKERIAELAKKYTIPAYVTEIDIEKTYCKYLLKKTKNQNGELDIFDISTEYDSNCNMTGNVVIEYMNGQTQIVDNEELMALTKERVLADKSFIDNNYQTLQNAYNKYDSFASFIDGDFLDIIPLQREELSKGENNKNG